MHCILQTWILTIRLVAGCCIDRSLVSFKARSQKQKTVHHHICSQFRVTNLPSTCVSTLKCPSQPGGSSPEPSCCVAKVLSTAPDMNVIKSSKWKSFTIFSKTRKQIFFCFFVVKLLCSGVSFSAYYR